VTGKTRVTRKTSVTGKAGEPGLGAADKALRPAAAAVSPGVAVRSLLAKALEQQLAGRAGAAVPVTRALALLAIRGLAIRGLAIRGLAVARAVAVVTVARAVAMAVTVLLAVTVLATVAVTLAVTTPAFARVVPTAST